jgi:PAS domain-containing protein
MENHRESSDNLTEDRSEETDDRRHDTAARPDSSGPGGLARNHERLIGNPNRKSLARMSTKDHSEMLSSVFDALPSPVFVVDEEVRIHEYNAAAAELLKTDRTTILKQRAGDVLHCLHSTDVPEGCGQSPFCHDCIIRGSVGEASKGNRVVRRRVRLELVRGGRKTEFYGLITASPFRFHKTPLVLLVIEDISEIAELRRMIPICARCKKVQDDAESWTRIETFFNDHWGVEFSHGLCPDCHGAEMDELDQTGDAARVKG